MGQSLSEAWGRPLIIDNRPGAGGNVGADLVAKNAPEALLARDTPLTLDNLTNSTQLKAAGWEP